MEVEFADADLERLEMDARFTGGHSPAVVRGFRKAINAIRAFHDERDFYANRGFRFEKLKGDRRHQRSIRINKQWRLILEIDHGNQGHRIRVMGIEDYH
jgi:proteic killer suppression protein